MPADYSKRSVGSLPSNFLKFSSSWLSDSIDIWSLAIRWSMENLCSRGIFPLISSEFMDSRFDNTTSWFIEAVSRIFRCFFANSGLAFSQSSAVHPNTTRFNISAYFAYSMRCLHLPISSLGIITVLIASVCRV